MEVSSNLSVVVSYKKQFLLGVLLLFVIIIAIEGIVRTYDHYNPNCMFISSEVFQDMDSDLKREVCHDNDDIIWADHPFLHLLPNQHLSTVNINSDGFRGSEITKEKSENTYRIFVVGGSTTFGVGATSDLTTIPGFLQKKFDDANLNFKVEVINAGIPKAYSFTETYYIKNILLEYDPDLFIIYDGWNDINRPYDVFDDTTDYQSSEKILRMILKNDIYKTGKVILKNYFNWRANENIIFDSTDIDKKVDTWRNNWSEICKTDYGNRFDVIMVLQPLVGTGNKVLTEEEQTYYKHADHYNLLQYYEKYAFALDELNSQCTKTKDMREIFDDMQITMYFDAGHTGDEGNRIIAEVLYETSKPIIEKRFYSFDN